MDPIENHSIEPHNPSPNAEIVPSLSTQQTLSIHSSTPILPSIHTLFESSQFTPMTLSVSSYPTTFCEPIFEQLSTSELKKRISSETDSKSSLTLLPIVIESQQPQQPIRKPKTRSKSTPKSSSPSLVLSSESKLEYFDSIPIDQLTTSISAEAWFMFLTSKHHQIEIAHSLPSDISFERQILFCSNKSLNCRVIIFDSHTTDSTHALQRYEIDHACSQPSVFMILLNAGALVNQHDFILRANENKLIRFLPMFDNSSGPGHPTRSGRRRPSKQYSVVFYANLRDDQSDLLQSIQSSPIECLLIWNTEIHHHKYEPRLKQHLDATVIRSQRITETTNWSNSIHQVASTHLDCTRTWLWNLRGDKVLAQVCKECSQLLSITMRQSLEWLLWS